MSQDQSRSNLPTSAASSLAALQHLHTQPVSPVHTLSAPASPSDSVPAPASVPIQEVHRQSSPEASLQHSVRVLPLLLSQSTHPMITRSKMMGIFKPKVYTSAWTLPYTSVKNG
ncbi:hypothetical protein ACOSP7_002121 [Xanthoceras sorbifolium]